LTGLGYVMNKKRNKKILIFILFGIFLFPLLNVKAVHPDNKVTLYFFLGKGCPHCTEEEKFLKKIEAKYPELEVKSHEVWYDQENAKLFSDMADAYGSMPEQHLSEITDHW
jgi:thiol-disulfide isomerase/thioredoxin